MAVIPQIGYKIDPNNPNAVIRDLSIPLSTLTSNEKPLNIQQSPQVPPPDIKNIPINSPTPASQSSNFVSEIETLTSKLFGKEAEIEKRTAEKTASYEQSLNELNTQIKLHQANALARQEEALKQGETLRYSTGLAGQVARTDAIEAMKLSALAQGMQGNILLAEKQARNAVEAEFAQTEKDLATARQNIINNYDTFTPAEKKRADAALLSLNEKDAFVARNKADREQSYQIALEAVKNGLTDNKLLTEIQNSTPEKALELAQPFLKEKVDPFKQQQLDLQKKEFELSQKKFAEDTRRYGLDYALKEKELAIKKEQEKIKATGEISSEAQDVLQGEFGDIIKSASNLVGAEKGKTSKISIAEAISKNDFPSAYAQIANNVEESLTGDVRTKFIGARTDYNVIQGLREAIQEFADAGGKLGYLKGTADEIARRFGQLQTDPKFATLAVLLEREFQSYRQQMTGAAFTPEESREYEKVNPRSNASLDLNLATIDGALRQLENRITSTVNSKIPNAKKIYQKISGDGLSDDDAYQQYLKLTGQSSGQR